MPLTFDESTALVGERFTAHTEIGPVALTLLEAQERPRRGLPAQFRTPLSLIFAAPASIQLRQGTYPMEHPRIGMQQWMLVPVLPQQQAPIASAENPSASDLSYYQVLFA